MEVVPIRLPYYSSQDFAEATKIIWANIFSGIRENSLGFGLPKLMYKTTQCNGIIK